MVRNTHWLALITVFLVAVSNATCIADEPIETLINQLVDINAPDTGYSQFFSGGNFLPYDDTESFSTGILGATGREKSVVMRKLVAAGADAVPELIKHLDDKRKVNLPPIESGGMMWIAFNNEYDYNWATLKRPLIGVNLDSSIGDGNSPTRHETTVGDLCFVALGQILNRRWAASRYQPTGGRIISSPTWSAELRKAIVDEWGGTNADLHRKSLIKDFKNPDSESRIIGAYQRLSLYYPNEVEALTLELLSLPIPTSDKTIEFATQLSEIKSKEKRLEKLNSILVTHGQHYRDAIQEQFFQDIISAHIREENGIDLNEEELFARKLLHETFGWPKPVSYLDWRRQKKSHFDNYELARIVKSLTHDNSSAIGEKIQKLLESDRFKDDVYMVEACLTSLASRKQFGEYLSKRIAGIDFSKATSNDVQPSHLEAIALSKSNAVQNQLQRITKQSNDADLFLIAANAIPKEDWAPTLKRTREVLAALPPDSKDGGQLLKSIAENSPGDLESCLVEFLKPDSPSRCNTVCEVLWYGNPLSQKLLLPLLDDTRQVPGMNSTVRQRAATAISHSIESIRFDSAWSASKREAVIEKIKAHCQSE